MNSVECITMLVGIIVSLLLLNKYQRRKKQNISIGEMQIRCIKTLFSICKVLHFFTDSKIFCTQDNLEKIFDRKRSLTLSYQLFVEWILSIQTVNSTLIFFFFSRFDTLQQTSIWTFCAWSKLEFETILLKEIWEHDAMEVG